MSESAFYLPRYAESHALVIGVDKYRHVSPLLHAANDARAVAQTLIDRFAFQKKNVRVLLNDQANRESILTAFLRLRDTTSTDDRILMFFAGHGHTVTGRRGETGFLVPANGKPNDLATLIRWDELTRNAELIPAKHVLFLMDACYGGLALSRTTIPPGSLRFLKDMLQRYARQVLTAGKADEQVADSGGTRPGHSIFTSHLLDGLDGAGIPSEGILSGHSLMAYVYDRVGNDPLSHQTPHFGFIDGDGDFVFDTSALSLLQEQQASAEPEPDRDVFIEAPMIANPPLIPESLADKLKRLIASPSERIRLNDCVFSLVRKTMADLGPDKFSPRTAVASEEFAERLNRYETGVNDLAVALALIAYWGDAEQVSLIEKALARLSESDRNQGGGFTVWSGLQWYPLLLLMYYAGISALAARKHSAVKAALLAPASVPNRRQMQEPILLPVIDKLTEIYDSFKLLPEMERKYVPRSEHILRRVQPLLEDLLFLGRSYEGLFDEFEIMLALSYANERDEDVVQHVWGPPGRFAWKERGRFSDEPVYTEFVKRAKAEGDSWGAIRAGFFRGSSQRFSDVADAYGKLLAGINWW